MINPRTFRQLLGRVAADDGNQCGGDVGGRGRRTVLVGHDAQAVAFTSQPQHGFDEVLPVRAEYPRSPHHHGAAAGGQHRLLSRQLACTVYVLRRGWCSFVIRRAARTVKHIISGNMQHNRAGGFGGFGGFGQMARTVPIDGKRPFGIALGFIDRRIGGGIDDVVGTEGFHRLPHAAAVGNIECGGIGDGEFGTALELCFQAVADLAAAAGNQDSG